MKFLRLFVVLLLSASLVTAQQKPYNVQAGTNTGGLKLQSGFSAAVIHPGTGRNRHLVVNSNGDIYVRLERLKNGNGILVLHEDASGKAQVIDSFANYTGTGIAIKN